MAGIGPSISLKGEKEFRQAISAINSEMKVLGSEMNKVTAEFSDNSKSVDALKARNEVLNKEIEKQTDKVSLLKGALSEAEKQYGESDKRTLNWKSSLNNAEAELTKLTKEVDKNEKAMKDAEKPTEEVGKELKTLGSNADDAGKKTSILGDVIKGKLISEAIVAGIKGLGNALKSAAVGLKDMAIESAAYADEVITTAAQTGLATDKIQELKYASELVDVPLETVTKTMARNIRAMGDAQSGTAQYVEAYEKLGISVTNADGTLRDSQTVYWELIDALGAIDNATERDSIAMDLLGRSAQELNPLILAGSATMEELATEAQNMGAVLSEDALTELGAFDDGMRRMENSMTSLKNNVGAVLAPALADLSELAASKLGAFSKSIQEAGGDVGKISEIVGNALLDMVNEIVEKLPDMMKGAISLIKAFMDGILSQLPAIATTAFQIVMQLVTTIIGMLPEIINTGMDLLMSLINGIANSIPQLIPVIIQAVMTIVKTLLDNLPELVRTALKMIMALAKGLVDAIPQLIEAIPEIIESLIQAIVEMLPEIIIMGVTLVIELGKGLIKAIPALIKNIPEIIKALINGFKNGIANFRGIGGDLISGLWQGIEDSLSWLWNKITDVANTIGNWFKDVFQIGSPSKLFADEIGANLGLGIGVGFEDVMKDVSKDMANAVPTDFDLNANVTGGVGMKSEIHLHIGTLVADEWGLKELERKLKNVRVQESYRLAGGLA